MATSGSKNFSNLIAQMRRAFLLDTKEKRRYSVGDSTVPESHAESKSAPTHIPPLPQQHTLGHVNCSVCERSRLALMRDAGFAELMFQDAAAAWIESRVKISPRTRQDYKQYARMLAPFFGQVKLRDIHVGMLRQYQVERAIKACAATINKELGLLLQVRRRAAIDDDLDELYEAMPLPYWKPPHTITDEEQQRFLKALRSRPEWEMVYVYAVIGLNTGMRGCELRGLRLGDIDTAGRTLFVGRDFAKTKNSVRDIPLLDNAFWAIQRAIELAKAKGSCRPEHFLFPRRLKRNTYEPNLPITHSGIKKPWAAAAKIADVPHFTPHGPRHVVNEKLWTSGADDMTILRIMGHQNTKASEHYSSIRKERARKVMEKAMSAVAGKVG